MPLQPRAIMSARYGLLPFVGIWAMSQACDSLMCANNETASLYSSYCKYEQDLKKGNMCFGNVISSSNVNGNQILAQHGQLIFGDKAVALIYDFGMAKNATGNLSCHLREIEDGYQPFCDTGHNVNHNFGVADYGSYDDLYCSIGAEEGLSISNLHEKVAMMKLDSYEGGWQEESYRSP